MTNEHLSSASRQLAELLEKLQLRLVLAESCTAGSVAAALGTIPGISQWLCGSFVIYRNDSKARWLRIPLEFLDDPSIGPVSSQVTRLLAQNALAATPEADLSAAVTGHIGPGSPADLDARVFFALAFRTHEVIREATVRLHSPAPRDATDIQSRQQRLIECSTWVLERICDFIQPEA